MTAEGGERALSLLGLGAPDVVVLDVLMPASTASRSAARLRAAATARRC